MSEQNYTPGTGIHREDLNAMTEYWHRETNYINDKVDSAFKSAQDDAYARGYRRGREDLIAIRKQRDELLAALISLDELCNQYCNWDRRFDDALDASKNAITRVKGGAA